jgi:hypothetical protein
MQPIATRSWQEKAVHTLLVEGDGGRKRRRRCTCIRRFGWSAMRETDVMDSQTKDTEISLLGTDCWFHFTEM